MFIRKFYYFTLIISLIINSGFSLNNQFFVFQAKAETIQDSYNQKKIQVEEQLNAINNQLNEILTRKDEISQQNFNLRNQEAKIRQEIQDLDKLIIDTKIVVSGIEKQIKDQEKKIDQLNNDLQILVLELQTEKRTPIIQVLVTGKNLSNILTNLYRLDNLEDKIQSKKLEIEKQKKQFIEVKASNLQAQEQLEKTRTLLKSRQSSLEITLAYNDKNFNDLVEAMKNQRKELDAQLDTISGDYLAEISQLRSQTEVLGGEKTTGCLFEETSSLVTSSNFFTKPTSGVVTQVFHCNHDGIDISSSLATNVVSVADGEVVRVGDKMDGCIGFKCNGGFGNYLVIKHTLSNNDSIYSLYGHLQEQPSVTVGQKVGKGQTVAKMGCTGYTIPFPCGVHLHFMLLAYNIDQYGVACKFGRNRCYNPQNYIRPIV